MRALCKLFLRFVLFTNTLNGSKIEFMNIQRCYLIKCYAKNSHRNNIQNNSDAKTLFICLMHCLIIISKRLIHLSTCSQVKNGQKAI